MSKAKCPKCGKEVSAMAMRCVSCGTRLYSEAEMLRPGETRKKKGTGTGWKFLQIIGVLITIVGIMEYLSTDKPGFYPFIILVGFGIFLLARIAARWRRG